MHDFNTTKKYQKHLRGVAFLALTISITFVLFKLITYSLTNSVIILSSAVDSALDALASLLNFIAVSTALKPSDGDHRFGHSKAEPVSGLMQSFFIIGSSIFLFVQAVYRLFNPVPIENSLFGIGVITASTLITVVLLFYQRWVIAKTGSVAIKADYLHYLSDVLVGVVVILGIVVTAHFEFWWLDPILAILIGLFIAYSAYDIFLNSLQQLMDQEFSDSERADVVRLALLHPGVHAIHGVRTRQAGQYCFIQMHLEMDEKISLKTAHSICNEVTASLHKAFPHADIITHPDPTNDALEDDGYHERYVTGST